jgi:hypothetical protein
MDPDKGPYREWEAAGFEKLDDLHATPRRPRLDCPMQSTD